MARRGHGGWLLALALAVAAAIGPARAQAEAHAPGPVVLADSMQWDQQAGGSGRGYRVFVSVPDRPPPAQGYPVLYVLDGNAMFLTAVEAVRAMERRPDVPKDAPAVVVGIGYPPGTEIGPARTLDLTPAGAASPRINAATGGADAFLEFIEGDLKPLLASRLRLDPRRQAIFGHSFAGLFVLHALAARPDAFQAWIAASPSTWMMPDGIRRELQGLVPARDAASPPLRLLVTAGEYEQRPAPAMHAHPRARHNIDHLQERRQVENARAMAELASQAPGLEARFDEIAAEDHGTVVPGAISRAVWFALAPSLPVPPVPEAQEYLRLAPEQRHDLRQWVRQLPPRERAEWFAQLQANLHHGLDPARLRALHDERERLDRQHGTRPADALASDQF